MPSWIPSALEQLWSFLTVALVVHALGRVSKGIATARGWHSASDEGEKSWYDITLRLHPMVAGALFGFLPLPTLHAIDALEGTSLLAARCAWFLLAGALCGQVYGAVKFAFTEGRDRILGLFGVGR